MSDKKRKKIARKQNWKVRPLMGFAAGAAITGLGGHAAFADPYDATPSGTTEGFEVSDNSAGQNTNAGQFSPGATSHTDATWSTGAGYPGQIPYSSTTSAARNDWADVRGGLGSNGGPSQAYGGTVAGGLITAVASGFEGVTSFGGAQHGLVMLGHGSNADTSYGGVIGRTGRSIADPLGAGVTYANRMHFYVSPDLKMQNSSASPMNFTWDTSAQNATPGGPSDNLNYSGEQSINWHAVNSTGTTTGSTVDGIFVDAPGGGTFIPNVVNTWLTAEMSFVNVAGTIKFQARIFNGAGTSLLFDSGLYGAGFSASTLGGPAEAFWFFNGDAFVGESMTDIAGVPVDNLLAGVAPLVVSVPEPASLLAMAATGSIIVLRRRRAAERV